MKGFAMLRIGEVGWVEKPRPVCGPMDAVCRPLAAAVCTSDVHTVWEGAVGDRHNLVLDDLNTFFLRGVPSLLHVASSSGKLD